MHKKYFFSYLILLSLQLSLFGQQQNPNIILIIADDLGIDVLNGYQDNDRKPITPVLDSLRTNGLKFTNTWAAPQCTPTRAAIMSGKYGIKTGVMRPPGNLDLVHESLFKRINEETNGLYAGAVIGKWHIATQANYDHPQEHGIDHYEGLFNSSVPDYYSWDKVEDANLVSVDEYVTSHLTDAAIDWVSQQSEPWFLWLAHVAPHSPFHVPPSNLYSQQDTSDNLGKYLAAIEAMDHEIGRLLNSLDEETRENTVIIFIGDNGTPGAVIQYFSGDHSKGTLYEGGVRVPMIISGKGVTRKNEDDDNLCHSADLYATILELTGTQLNGGTHNSMSLKPLLSCNEDLNRTFIYTDYEDGNILGWAIRTKAYKLIEDENGRLEFYNLDQDLLETNNLIGNLSSTEQELLTVMQQEAQVIRIGWRCNDGIQNGDETTLDDCNDVCTNDNSLSTTNIGCCETPAEPSVYYEYIEGNRRNIYSNSFPNHNYCYNSPNQMPDQTYHDFGIDLNPAISGEITGVTRPNGRPARYFGVAKNGVIFAPAPAAPFIFENQITGELNWDWVFEPTNNQGSGPNVVGLDCASAHTGGQGYHYHGNMFEYVDQEVPGISSTTTIPSMPLHIGWAADGFPILYKFGPDANGNFKELMPSFQLKAGLRQGDGITEPCGPHNGKYTRDYEFICGKGDLDECNGIQSSITIPTANGMHTFEYFYIISSSFPQIPRCLVGNVSTDFDNDNDPIVGVDNDNDGFLSEYDCNDSIASVNPNAIEIPYNGLDDDCDESTLDDDLDGDGFVLAEDCDDTNNEINPNAVEIPNNNIDEDCDGMDLITAVQNLSNSSVNIFPNPSSEFITIEFTDQLNFEATIYDLNGRIIKTAIHNNHIGVSDLSGGTFLLEIKDLNSGQRIIERIAVIK